MGDSRTQSRDITGDDALKEKGTVAKFIAAVSDLKCVHEIINSFFWTGVEVK